MSICYVLKEVMVPVLCTILGALLGFISGLVLGRIQRTQVARDDFARLIMSIRDELASRPDNVDAAFDTWRRNSVRRLMPQAHYLSIAHPRWWAKIDEQWQQYEHPSKQEGETNFMIDRDKLLVRLNHLLRVVREA